MKIKNKELILKSMTLIILILMLGFSLKYSSNESMKQNISTNWKSRMSNRNMLSDKNDFTAIIEIGSIVKEYEQDNIPVVQYNAKILSSTMHRDRKNIVITMTGANNSEKSIENEDEFLIFARKNRDGTYTILNGIGGKFEYTDKKHAPRPHTSLNEKKKEFVIHNNPREIGEMQLNNPWEINRIHTPKKMDNKIPKQF